MKRQMNGLLVGLVLVGFLAASGLATASEPKQEWELVSPEGAIQLKPMELNPHPASLEGKTVGLIWNSKHNGNNFLDRVAELLVQQVKGVKVIKFYEPPYDFIGYHSGNKALQKKITDAKPDIIIASQAD